MINPIKKLTRSFLYSFHGPRILALLATDQTCARVFSKEVVEIIERQKKEGKGGAKINNPSSLDLSIVLDAFVQKTCPAFKDKAQILHWVLKQYLSHKHNDKPILAEDLYKIGESLNYFESLKHAGALIEEPQEGQGHAAYTARVQQRHDLLKYKTYQELLDTLQPFEQQKAKKEASALERQMTPEGREILKSETTILYNGPLGKVVVPHTPKSSQYWGNNTKWCIAGKDAKSFFANYNQQSPAIFILPKGKENDKIALVDKTLYNSQDKVIEGLPQEHQDLLKTCLVSLKPQTRKGVEAWVPETVHTLLESNTSQKTGNADAPAATSAENIPEAWKPLLEKIRLDDPLVLASADPALKSDPLFMLEAVKQNGYALEYAAPELQSDREIVLAAVKQDGWALRYAAPELTSDPLFMLEAVKQNGYALQYSPPTFSNDLIFVTECLQDSDDLPFTIQAFGGQVSKPDDKTIAEYQLKALERMLERGDVAMFQNRARQFKSTWGDPDILFAGTPQVVLEKIREEMGLKYPGLGQQTSVTATASRRSSAARLS